MATIKDTHLVILQQLAVLLVFVAVRGPVEVEVSGDHIEHDPLLDVPLPLPTPPPEFIYPLGDAVELLASGLGRLVVGPGLEVGRGQDANHVFACSVER